MKIQLLIMIASILAVVGCKSEKEETPTVVVEAVDTIPEKVHVPKFDYDTTKWLDLSDIDPTIKMDLRYATKNNFVEEKMYICGRCFQTSSCSQNCGCTQKITETRFRIKNV